MSWRGRRPLSSTCRPAPRLSSSSRRPRLSEGSWAGALIKLKAQVVLSLWAEHRISEAHVTRAAKEAAGGVAWWGGCRGARGTSLRPSQVSRTRSSNMTGCKQKLPAQACCLQHPLASGAPRHCCLVALQQVVLSLLLQVMHLVTRQSSKTVSSKAKWLRPLWCRQMLPSKPSQRR